MRGWQALSEPEAGSDLANQKTVALRDGEDYIINGPEDLYRVRALRRPPLGADQHRSERQTHQNLSYFYIDAHLPGITIQRQDILGGEPGGGAGDKNDIFFDNVRVPAFHLIGGENNGWGGEGHSHGDGTRRKRQNQPRSDDR